MPTYDYLCDACGHAFEEFQAMSDPVLVKCPGCGKRKLRRLFGTGAGIIFKGSGFYETDYRKKSGKKERDADGKSAAKEKSDAKGDTKPEAKSGGKTESKPKPDSPKPAAKKD